MQSPETEQLQKCCHEIPTQQMRPMYRNSRSAGPTINQLLTGHERAATRRGLLTNSVSRHTHFRGSSTVKTSEFDTNCIILVDVSISQPTLLSGLPSTVRSSTVSDVAAVVAFSPHNRNRKSFGTEAVSTARVSHGRRLMASLLSTCSRPFCVIFLPLFDLSLSASTLH